MMRSLFSGVSGLKNHQTRMDVIGNNISNVNTNGFKSSRVTFADTLNQTMTGASAPNGTIGGTNPKQVGLGSAVSSIDLLFTDGSVQSTGKNTDLCLSGNGLFVVSNGNQTYYTRNGAFEFDAEGNYTMPGSGLLVQGWTATDGVLNTSSAVGNIVVPAGKSMAAKATNIATYANNLNSAVTTISSAEGGTATQSIVASDGNEVILKIGGKDYTASEGTFSGNTTYTVVSSVAIGAKSVVLKDSEGNLKTVSIAAATDPITAGSEVKVTGGKTVAMTRATTSNPVTISTGAGADEKKYIVTSGTFSNVETYTLAKAVSEGDKVIAIKDSSNNTQTLTLQTAVATGQGNTAGTAATYAGGETLNMVTASNDNPVTLSMSDGTTVTETSGTYVQTYSLPVTTTLTIYDTLGNVHSLPVYFTKSIVDSTSGNQWTVSLNSNTADNSVVLQEADGSLTTVTMNSVTLQFTTDGKYSTGSGTSALTLTNGSTGTQKVTLDLSTLTQFAGNNTVNGSTNGNAAGTLESIAIDSSGIITGTYTNGVKQTEAQVAVAQFTNASGLTKTGSSLYQESNNSGTANVKTAADLGVKITASALEMSNVDIANEFADMIITQRGFQSNSKIITVGDEMLETVINMKR